MGKGSNLFFTLMILLLILLNPSIRPVQSNLSLNVLSYRFTGYVSENGDDKWDSSEYDLFTYKVLADELFEVELSLSRDVDVYLMFFKGSSVEAIEEAMTDLAYYGYSSSIYSIEITSGGYTKLTYQATNQVIGRIAVFSYSTYTYTSVSYTLRSSIPQGSARDIKGPDYATTNQGADSEGSSSLGFLVLIIIVIAGIVLIVRSRNKSKTQKYENYQYVDTTSYSQKTNNNSFLYQPTNLKQNQQINPLDSFCNTCGSGMRPSQRFCNSCGSKV